MVKAYHQTNGFPALDMQDLRETAVVDPASPQSSQPDQATVVAGGKETGDLTGSEFLQQHLESDRVAKRSLVDLIKVGSELFFVNNKRALVTECSDSEITFVELKAHGLFEKVIPVESFRAGGLFAISEVCNAIEPCLINGHLEVTPLDRPPWKALKAGDQLFYKNASGEVIAREEICAIRPAPNENSSIQQVDSVFYMNGKIIPRFEVKRADRELVLPGPAGSPPPEVRRCKAFSRINNGSATQNGTGLTEGVTGELFSGCADLLSHMEQLLASKFARVSDWLVDRRQVELDANKLDAAFEELLSKQVLIRERTEDFVESFKILLAEVYTRYNGACVKPEGLRVAENLSYTTAFFRDLSPERTGMLAAHFECVLDLISQDAEATPYALQDTKDAFAQLENELEAAATTANWVTQELDTGASLDYTELLSPVDVARHATEIYHLITEAQRPESSAAIKENGVIMGSYFSPEYLIAMSEQGAQLLVSRNADTAKVTGFIFYFLPGQVPEDAKGVPDEHRSDGSRSCADLVRVGKDAARGTFRKLINSMLIHLQRTQAKYSYGEVLAKNQRSFGALVSTGHRPDISRISISVGKDGQINRWMPMELLVRPEERARKISLIKQQVKELVSAFEEQLENDPEEHIRDRLARIDEVKQLDDFAHFARREVKSKVFTRFSLGAGNMTAAENRRLQEILTKGCAGMKGVVSWGASTMLQMVDEQVVAVERSGGQAMLHKIMQNASDDVLVAGVNTYDPDQIDEITVKGFNNDQPILVISSESGASFMTVADPDIACRLYFDGTKIKDKPIWDVEAIKSREIARRLREIELEERAVTRLKASGAGDVDVDNTPAFRNINIFGSGGGTIGREIQDLADEAYADSDADLHIVLVKLVGDGAADREGQLSAADRLALDDAFIEKHRQRALALGRESYIHVVESAEELQAVLQKLDAVEIDSEEM